MHDPLKRGCQCVYCLEQLKLEEQVCFCHPLFDITFLKSFDVLSLRSPLPPSKLAWSADKPQAQYFVY